MLCVVARLVQGCRPLARGIPRRPDPGQSREKRRKASQDLHGFEAEVLEVLMMVDC